MKKRIFIIFSIISVFFFNIDYVFAFELHTYDNSVTLFDKWGNDLPPCVDNIYTHITTPRDEIHTDLYPSGTLVCNRNRAAALDTFKEALPYHTRIDYTSKFNSSNTFSVMVATPYPLFIDTHGASSQYSSLYKGRFLIKGSDYHPNGLNYFSGLVFFLMPSNCILETNNGSVSCLGGRDTNGNSPNYDNWNHLGISAFDSDYDGWSVVNSNFDINYNRIMNSNLYNAKIVTNYDLKDDEDNLISSKINSFEFNTDSDLNIKYEEYAILIPKHNSAFDSYIWTDSQFYYDTPKYNENNGFYDYHTAGFDKISFGYLNGFNWFRWDFSFTNQELSENKVILIYNHNQNRELNIKYFSDDFYVRLMNKNSEGFEYNGVYYSNDWERLKQGSSKHEGLIESVYDVDMFNDLNTYTKNLPNLIKQFSLAFSFIGTLISNAFNLFSSEILTYFYVLFGLMLIMLIIMIMK